MGRPKSHSLPRTTRSFADPPHKARLGLAGGTRRDTPGPCQPYPILLVACGCASCGMRETLNRYCCVKLLGGRESNPAFGPLSRDYFAHVGCRSYRSDPNRTRASVFHCATPRISKNWNRSPRRPQSRVPLSSGSSSAKRGGQTSDPVAAPPC